METEVYLLSIPLARHRNIVPRHHRTAGKEDGFGRPIPRALGYDIADTTVGQPTFTGTLQRDNSD
jgi:hypothetical protein